MNANDHTHQLDCEARDGRVCVPAQRSGEELARKSMMTVLATTAGAAQKDTRLHIPTEELYAMAWKLARSFKPPRYLDREDLVQEGVEYALIRMDDYDPKHGASLATWCYNNIEYGIRGALREYRWGRTTRYRDKIIGEPGSIEAVAYKSGVDVANFIPDAEIEFDYTAADLDFKIRTLLTDRERQIIRMLQIGMGHSEIAEALKVSRETVHNRKLKAAEKLGLKRLTERPERKSGYTEDEVAEMVRLYGEGATQRELSAAFGGSQPTVRRALEAAGVKARGAHARAGVPQKPLKVNYSL